MNVLHQTRRDDLVVLTGEVTPDPEAITTIDLELLGATLSFDINNPGAMTLEIFDLEASLWWLSSFFGDAAAEKILQHEMSSKSGDVTFEVGSALQIARRAAAALWLRRWWPAKDECETPERLVEWILDVEAAALLYKIPLTLDHDFAGIADRLAAHHTDPLVRALQAHNDRCLEGGADEEVAKKLLEYAQVILEMGSLDDSDHDILEHVVEQIVGFEADIRQTQDQIDDFLANANETSKARGSLALTAGDSYEQTSEDLENTHTYSGPVFIDCVPSRVFSTESDAVEWVITEDDGGTRCDIRVYLAEESLAHPKIGEYFALVGSLTHPTVVALHPREDMLEGAAWIDANIEYDDVKVHVFGRGREGRAALPHDSKYQQRDLRGIVQTIKERITAADPRKEPSSHNANDRIEPFLAEKTKYLKIRLQNA